MRQKLLSLFILLILGFAGLEGRGQTPVNITPIRTDVSGFATWTDTNIGGSSYLQLLVATSVTISPAMNFDSYTSEKLTFKARTYGGTNATENTVYIVVSTDNGATWSTPISKTPTTSSLTSVGDIDLSSYSGTSVKVKFYVAGTNNTIGVGIDDITITGIESSTGLTPPTLTPDATSNTVDNNIDITFSDNQTWIDAVTSVKVDSNPLTENTDYEFTSAGNLQLKSSGGNSALQTSGDKSITVEATGYSNAIVTQTLLPGAATKLLVATQPTAPAVNGGALAAQPKVNVTDQYGNIVTSSSASVTAAVGAGSWTMGGTTSVNAASGVATFAGLTATSASLVNGATITFTSGSLTSATSASFNIPAPLLATPVAIDATEVSANSFKANWNSVSGATGYKLDVSEYASFSNGSAVASDLFISEYVEGSSNNKYIEIYNGTGSSVDLSDYQLLLFNNGSPSANNTATSVLSGILGNNSVLVLKNSSASLIPGITMTDHSACNYNGDDAIALKKISTSSYVDIIGRIGEDPGSAWTSGSFSTENKTLVRKSTVTGGVTVNPASGFPTLETEWTQYNTDVVTNLGSHDGGSTPSFIAGYDNKSVSGTSDIVNGLEANKIYYYRVRATDGSQTTENSNVITATTIAAPVISVFSGTGNWFDFARWSNGIPSTTTNATISGNATVIGAANCHDLTISSTASLTVSGSNELYVFGDFEIQSSGASTGSFIGAEKTGIDGNATVQCYVSADNYHYISSPVAPQSFGSIFLANQDNIYLRRYNEPTGEWVNMLKTDNSEIGLGYSVTMNAAQTGSFSGVLNDSDVTKTLSKAGTASGGSANDYNGWNLIGNPFSSAINWADVLAANPPALGFESSAYIWSGSNYIATNGTSGGISGNLIPICSGFFVKASTNGAQILIPTSAQAHSNHGIYKEAILNNLAVKVTGDQYEDQTFVRFHDQATEGFDSRWDARKLEGLNEAPQLYTIAGEYKLSINEQPKQSKRDIPMNFSCGVDGQYTLTFSGVESFESPSRITLEDKLLGSTIDVTNSLSYNFSYNTTDDEGRFILHFSTATGISDKEVQNIQIWAANHQLFIDNQAGVVGDVTLYDITGKKILAKQVTEGKSIINVNGFNGTYIVRIATVKGVVTKKVVLL